MFRPPLLRQVSEADEPTADTERELEGYRFTVPGDPVSVNRMYGNRKGGGKYLKPEALAWKESVGWAARKAGVKVCEGPMAVSITYLHRYPVQRLDVDNLLKLCIDSLNGIGWRDDKQVLSVFVEAVYEPNAPGVEVWVRRVGRGEKE